MSKDWTPDEIQAASTAMKAAGHMGYEEFCAELKPAEDIFLREDSFAEEPWYREFQIFLRIGVCCPDREHLGAVENALARMGYATERTEHGGVVFITGKSAECP